jgi:hypothetical protein
MPAWVSRPRAFTRAARQQFDARVKALVDGLSAGTLDSATQANLAQLMHLAQSIRFD